MLRTLTFYRDYVARGYPVFRSAIGGRFIFHVHFVECKKEEFIQIVL